MPFWLLSSHSGGGVTVRTGFDEDLYYLKLSYSFDEDLDYLKRSKIILEDQIKYAEKRYLQHRVRISINSDDPWLSISNTITLMKSTNYDIEDIINDSHHLKEEPGDTSCLRKVSSFFSCYNPIITKVKLIERMKSVRKDLQIIQSDLSSTRALPFSEQPGSSYVNISSPIIGRDVDFSRVMNLLKMSSDKGISVIPILGPVGSGKSTIACLIYFDTWVEKEFNHRIWLSLAMHTVDIKGIAKKIISEAGKTICGNMELKSKFHHILKHESCLIVLDGLWADDQKIIELKQMLQTGSASKSKIIVTTHNEFVANLIASSQVYRLHLLSDEHCSLVFQSALIYQSQDTEIYRDAVVDQSQDTEIYRDAVVDQSQDTEIYRDAVLARCEGNPLVAKFLGFVVDSGRGSLEI
ncbi:disease resistance protein RGA2-like [Lolium rigidum]|uniref:disease resistance protein RGA2-like n=1 Tax=Lolium rigidum TaxID=89674 RepID=UPI001F5D85DF|nr:disease resistance protein RGA2-like [Lolium rigidum]